MIFITLTQYWQVLYPMGHNPYGSNECKIHWNCNWNCTVLNSWSAVCNTVTKFLYVTCHVCDMTNQHNMQTLFHWNMGTYQKILKLLQKFWAPISIFWWVMVATDRHTEACTRRLLSNKDAPNPVINEESNSFLICSYFCQN